MRFAAGLYRGTAGYYDNYRLPYPDAMIEYVAGQAMADGPGRDPRAVRGGRHGSPGRGLRL